MNINPFKKKDPFIWIKDHDLEPDICKQVIDKFENEDRKKLGMFGNNITDTSIKTSIDYHIRYGITKWEPERKIFYDALHVDIQQYVAHLKSFLPEGKMSISKNITDSGYQIQRTDPGGFYTWHHDCHACPSMGVRLFTYIWYLNDVKRGGYTEFASGIKVKPKQGRVLMFPATWDYIHRGYPPKDEIKYIVTGWVYDMGMFSA